MTILFQTNFGSQITLQYAISYEVGRGDLFRCNVKGYARCDMLQVAACKFHSRVKEHSKRQYSLLFKKLPVPRKHKIVVATKTHNGLL